jgi:hypothetical protein
MVGLHKFYFLISSWFLWDNSQIGRCWLSCCEMRYGKIEVFHPHLIKCCSNIFILSKMSKPLNLLLLNGLYVLEPNALHDETSTYATFCCVEFSQIWRPYEVVVLQKSIYLLHVCLWLLAYSMSDYDKVLIEFKHALYPTFLH